MALGMVVSLVLHMGEVSVLPQVRPVHRDYVCCYPPRCHVRIRPCLPGYHVGLPPGPPGTDYFGLPWGWGGLCVAIHQGSSPVRRESRNGRCSKYQLGMIVETTYLAL